MFKATRWSGRPRPVLCLLRQKTAERRFAAGHNGRWREKIAARKVTDRFKMAVNIDPKMNIWKAELQDQRVSTTVWVEGREMIFPCPCISLFPDAAGNVNRNNGCWNDRLATGTLIIALKKKRKQRASLQRGINVKRYCGIFVTA